jgi:subtilisin family serine protease
VAAVAALALGVAVPTVSAAAPAARPHPTFAKAPSSGRLAATVMPRALRSTKKVDVIVQLTGDPVAVAEAKSGSTFSETKRKQVKAKLRTAQDTLGTKIAAKGGKVTYHMQSAYNGVRVRIQASKISSLTTLPGVAAVHTLTPKSLDNTESVPFIGTGTAWQAYGKTGKGVKIAIIDTGIDYTHADFGGPGTTDAFDTAKANSTKPADSSLFGPKAPRVKGGYDFVGDDYDADSDGAAAVPVPDPNPLDCQGHGSHVAGTAAGSGVTTEGKTYTGPYNEGTQKNTSFNVGPGVAPQAELYALRVFGCDGSTDVTTEAIDWAVDHQMDVINMSLGSTFGSSTDPDSVAASNAVAAGVVVVASAGNEGPSPYMVGSPSVGQGVVSVAAIDSNSQFAGASLKSGETTVTAINANNATIPSGDFTVVVLADVPGTADENEALGCSVEAFEAAGIEPGKNQLAVVDRGTCARAAKPIFGQQAGAAAVLMVNNADGFPPFEGRITYNPDDPSQKFTVTIPFLGVSQSDGSAVKALAGKTLTMTSVGISNPGFRGYASFSSGGPATGDSGLSPSVAAPGVSIASAAVGTGTDSAILSGTSMAAPHVAGVAALAVQAHPTWRASQIASAIVGTADPEKVEKDNSVRLGGTGLVDPAQVVATQAFVTGDRYFSKAGAVWEDSLSFGFAESNTSFVKSRTITITNTGRVPVTYTLSAEEDASSLDVAAVRFSSKRVVVPARGSASVRVTLSAQAASIPSSVADDQWGFHELSGQVLLTGSDKSKLRVPYLLVPRATTQLSATLAWGSGGKLDIAKASSATSVNVKLANPRGALTASADFYTLGLTDRADVSRKSVGSGYDLRAAGVQSFDGYSDENHPDDTLLVFAVNNYSRWSNAATNEFDVLIDTDGDSKPDWAVFTFDSGYVRTEVFNGITEVFYSDLHKENDLNATGFLAGAPTDSSTILLPVIAGDLGLTESGATKGAFSYTVQSSTVLDVDAGDSFNGLATYNPWAKAVEDGLYETVKPNRTLTVPVAVNPANWAIQKPKGLMVVSLDNKAGAEEAQLVTLR